MPLANILDRKAILASAASLPAAPLIMARLYRMLLNFNTGLDQVVGLLKRDPSLTARIIRIANSPACGSGGVDCIEEAVQRVGFWEVYSLVGTAVNASLGRQGLRCYGLAAESFRRHNLCSALVSEQLATVAGLDARAAYTAGLLRRIGQMLLDGIGRDHLVAAETFPENGAGRVVEWERRTFGVGHHEVGGAILAEWGFPDNIIEAVEHGYKEVAEMSPLGCVVDLADNIVNLSGFGLFDGDAAEAGISREKLDAAGIGLEAAQGAQAGALERFRLLEIAQHA